MTGSFEIRRTPFIRCRGRKRRSIASTGNLHYHFPLPGKWLTFLPRTGSLKAEEALMAQPAYKFPTEKDGPGWPAQGEWTYEDYLRLPEDGNRYEVIRGVLYVSPAPLPEHQ